MGSKQILGSQGIQVPWSLPGLYCSFALFFTPHTPTRTPVLSSAGWQEWGGVGGAEGRAGKRQERSKNQHHGYSCQEAAQNPVSAAGSLPRPLGMLGLAGNQSLLAEGGGQ